MSNILKKIEATKFQEVERLKSNVSLNEIMAHNKLKDSCRDFVGSIKKNHLSGRSSVIAEIKKASPSKGVIREQFNPVDIAKSYEEYGAACLSILTDEQYFQGNLKYLNLVKQEVKLPILRKDFIVDPYQIYEAKINGADCILLIAAILTDQQLVDYEKIAQDLGMAVLVEAHDEKELDASLKLQTELVGINNRNLKTFDVTLDTTIDLKNKIGKDKVVVTESGIFTRFDVELMNKHDVHTFLIGESFMRHENPGVALNELFETR
jgi:indole-3-glycerol phosphate synthase